MAILSRIEAENLKGRSFAYDLPKRLAIVGPNFAGKTAIIEAIRLALMGYIPEIGKRASATWELASGNVMGVAVHFDNKSAITRTFTNGKAALHTNAGERPVDWIGNEFLDDNGGFILPLLNAEQYFGLTDKERVAYVFDRVKLPDSYTPESIIAEAERLSLEERHSEQVEKAKAGAIVHIRAAFKGRSIQDGLTECVRQFKELFTYWNARAKETVGAVRLLTELKNREGEVSAETFTALEIEAQAAQKAVDELNQKIGEAKARQKVAEQRAGRIATLRKYLAEPVTDYPHMIAKEREKIDALVVVPEEGAATIGEWMQEKEIVAVRWNEQAARLLDLKKLIADSNEQFLSLAELKCCPYCHSKGRDWKEHLRAELEQTITRTTQRVIELETEVQSLDGRNSELAMRIHAANQVRNDNQAKRLQIERHETAIRVLEADARRQQEREMEWREELALLNSETSPTGDTSLGEEFLAATARLTAVLERKQKATQLQQDLRRAAEAQLEHMDAEAHLLVVKALAKMIGEKRDRMIDDVFGGLIRTANQMFGDVVTLAFHDGEVGKWAGAKFVPHRVFSGVEKAITYVAIAAALSSQAPLRLLILDELGRMTPKVRLRILHGISEAITAGIIDQSIVVIPSDEPIAIEGWDVLFLIGEDLYAK